MTDLTQDIFLKRPISEKPDENGEYLTIGFGFGKTMFKDGKWLDWTEKNTHYLQPMKLQDVLGSLKVPVWKRADDELPALFDSHEIHYRIMGKKIDGARFFKHDSGEITFEYQHNSGFIVY